MRADVNNSESLGFNKYIKVTIIGVLSGTATIIALFVVAAFVMDKLNVPLTLIPVVSTIAGALGSFVASFVVCKIIRKKGMLIGFLCGLVLCLIIFIAGNIFSEISLGIGALSKIFAIIIASVIGGVLGVNSKRK